MLHNGRSRFRCTPGTALLLACVVLAAGIARATPAAARPAAHTFGVPTSGPAPGAGSAARTRSAPRSHIVQPGETLTAIALQYGVTIVAIAQANSLANPSLIYAGQQLVIPPSGSAPAPPSGAPNQGQGVHVVQPGETLTAIAQRYGVPVSAIAQANGLADPNRIYAGQQLVLPGGGAAVAPPPAQEPLAEEVAELAAIVYAEAQANPVDFDEMLAIASVVRNRVEHVAVYPSDQRWFGGPGYHSVLSNRREFPGYGTPRYWNFLAGAVGSPSEQSAAESALRAAAQVHDGGAVYPFVFFQQAVTRPSVRAALPPVRLGAHHFWSFRPECVNPLAPCSP